MFTYSEEKASLAAAVRAMDSKAAGFSVSVQGRAEGADIGRKLIAAGSDFLLRKYNWTVSYEAPENRTTARFSGVEYVEDNVYDMVVKIDGLNELAAAVELSCTARSPYTLLVIQLHAGEMAELLNEGFTDAVTGRLKKEFDRLSVKSSCDKYDSQKRNLTYSWWRNSGISDVIFCRLKYDQFEDLGMRAGVSGEIYRLCHELFARKGLTDRQKVLEADKWMRNNIVYDDSGDMSHSAAVTLLTGRGVCQSIASLMMTILQAEGIPAVYVVSTDGTHAWNRVRIGGRWLNLDTTWGLNYRGDDHPYLLREDNDFPHEWDRDEYSPEKCDARWNEFCRKRSRRISFSENSSSFSVRSLRVRRPGVTPMIMHRGRAMVSLSSLFGVVDVGFRRCGRWICIYTKERPCSFRISLTEEAENSACQAIEKDGEYYISVKALSTVPGFSAERGPDGEISVCVSTA